MRIGKRIFFSKKPIIDDNGKEVYERDLFNDLMKELEEKYKDDSPEYKSTKIEMAISSKFNLDIVEAADAYEVYKQYIKYNK